MSTLHRAQLLLESEQHQSLVKIAETEGRSLSDLVREILSQHLAERDKAACTEKALKALEELSARRHRLQEEHGIYDGDLVAEVRAERDEELARAWQAEA